MQLTETGPVTNADLERRFNHGAWLTLAAAVLILLWALAMVIVSLQYPTDGWASVPVTDGPSRSGPFILEFPTVSEATGLLAGDVVTAIDGRTLVEGQLPPLPPPWTAGQTVEYTVQRAGETLPVDVVLVDSNLGTFLAYAARSWAFTIASLIWLAVAGIVFCLRPGNPATRYLLIASAYMAGVVFNNFVKSSIGIYAQPPAAVWLTNAYSAGVIWIFSVSLILFISVFPTPLWPINRVPRGVLLLAYGLAVGSQLIAWPRYPTLTMTAAQTWVAALAFLGTFVAVLLTIAWSLYYNIRRSHDPVAKAQYRWLAFGLVVGLAPYFLWPIVPIPWSANNPQIIYNVTTLLSIVFPISLAIGILRYRLFDIDVIIRRTTSYALLTGILLLVYFGSIVVLQRLLSPITGDSDAAVVLSTLLIAALFLPLRRRVQGIIDRRFFRSKYDAEKVLEQFAATVRDETDLDELTAELVRVIQETMQPEFVSVWLKPSVDRQPSSLVNSE